jgi:hypothetical protein
MSLALKVGGLVTLCWFLLGGTSFDLRYGTVYMYLKVVPKYPHVSHPLQAHQRASAIADNVQYKYCKIWMDLHTCRTDVWGKQAWLG